MPPRANHEDSLDRSSMTVNVMQTNVAGEVIVTIPFSSFRLVLGDHMGSPD